MLLDSDRRIAGGKAFSRGRIGAQHFKTQNVPPSPKSPWKTALAPKHCEQTLSRKSCAGSPFHWKPT
jgi:hypothetical protein